MTNQQNSLVHARGLTKRYANGFTAVDGVDFDVRPGKAFGFLGPNGAGKTSTMRMIACSSPVTEGTLSVIGMDPRTQAREIKSKLGVVPHGRFTRYGFSQAILLAARGVSGDVVGRTHAALATAGALRHAERPSATPSSVPVP